jgi:phospholipid transport system transporter-binding protein
VSVACGVEGAPPLEAGESGFAPADDNARWLLEGEVTTATASHILAAAAALPLPSSGVIDCDRVRLVDSTAVALLLAVKRRAKSERRRVSFVNVPAPLMALAGVYGVADLLVG